MAWQQPSPRIRELIREGARIALNPSPEWIEELDRATIAANPAIANDPVLAKVVQTANRANLVYWAAANLRDPGARVPANLGTEPLRMARDLVRRGLDTVAFNIYRTGEHIGWRFWMGIAFELTSDPQELRELLDVSARSVNDFIEATLTGIAAQVQSEHDEAKLGYPLSRAHTAAIIWSDELDGDHSYLDRAADLFCHAVGSTRPLTVVAGAASRWAWVTDADGLDIDTVQAAVDNAPGARIAIGTTANGVEGFRRSHLEALITQRTLSRLRSTQRVAFFADVKMVALISQNPDAASEFITSTLGDLESASPDLQTALLTFINEQCNASRAAKRLHTHRNTFLRRLESAQRLLPRPLDHTSVHVAVALEALQWRGNKAHALSSPGRRSNSVPA